MLLQGLFNITHRYAYRGTERLHSLPSLKTVILKVESGGMGHRISRRLCISLIWAVCEVTPDANENRIGNVISGFQHLHWSLKHEHWDLEPSYSAEGYMMSSCFSLVSHIAYQPLLMATIQRFPLEISDQNLMTMVPNAIRKRHGTPT